MIYKRLHLLFVNENLAEVKKTSKYGPFIAEKLLSIQYTQKCLHVLVHCIFGHSPHKMGSIL